MLTNVQLWSPQIKKEKRPAPSVPEPWNSTMELCSFAFHPRPSPAGLSCPWGREYTKQGWWEARVHADTGHWPAAPPCEPRRGCQSSGQLFPLAGVTLSLICHVPCSFHEHLWHVTTHQAGGLDDCLRRGHRRVEKHTNGIKEKLHRTSRLCQEVAPVKTRIVPLMETWTHELCYIHRRERYPAVKSNYSDLLQPACIRERERWKGNGPIPEDSEECREKGESKAPRWTHDSIHVPFTGLGGRLSLSTDHITMHSDMHALGTKRAHGTRLMVNPILRTEVHSEGARTHGSILAKITRLRIIKGTLVAFGTNSGIWLTTRIQ